jgi:hypothetical protein
MEEGTGTSFGEDFCLVDDAVDDGVATSWSPKGQPSRVRAVTTTRTTKRHGLVSDRCRHCPIGLPRLLPGANA